MSMDETHQRLLQTLKSVVEGLLNCQVANVWNIYGGLSRLHGILERIFKHEFRIFKQNGEEDCWIFIQGLNWLQPSLATSPTPVSPSSPPPHPHTDKAMIWLHNSLETHTLSEKIAWLVSDEQHLASCYNPDAFLRRSQYVEAALLCLRAIEQNQLSLLTEIHPSLYLSERSLRAQEKFHRRCSSFPETLQRTMWTQKPSTNSAINNHSNTELSDLVNKSTSPTSNFNNQVVESSIAEETVIKNDKPKVIFYKEKLWRSLPSLINEELILGCKGAHNYMTKDIRKNKTEPSSPSKVERRTDQQLTPSLLKIDYNDVIKENEFIIKANRYEKLKRVATSTSSGESVDTLVNRKPERRKKKSFIEDGGSSVKPMSTGPYFPKPKQGQSLTSFLSSGHFTQTAAELDRENAHFSISEAIIAAIEQVKCNKWEKMVEEVAAEESDDEIKELKQRIRIRRKLKQEEKVACLLPSSLSDTTATDQSFSPRSSDDTTGGVSDDSLSTEDDVEDLEVDQITPTNLADIKKSGLSLSMASLYSEADLSGRNSKSLNNSVVNNKCTPVRSMSPNNCDQTNSAEIVALSLLSKFSDRQLPKASDIQWLVSEKDAPQQLLPLPDSFVADDQDFINATPLRGTAQWAPPRPQIIFTTHPPPQRRLQMIKQNMQCAGCGMKVLPEYAHKFRYCDYLARYFCTGCHSNKQYLIPGRILAKWDFHKYPVSNFSYNLLDQMCYDPLFNVMDINAGLYKRVKSLERVRNLRLQLISLKEFLYTCRYAKELKMQMMKECGHLMNDVDTYSIHDFSLVKFGDLHHILSQFVVNGTSHVAKCQLCLGRGFMCEMCNLKDVIFPWQLGKVTRCQKCGSCHHFGCARKNLTCPKCDRIASKRTPGSMLLKGAPVTS